MLLNLVNIFMFSNDQCVCMYRVLCNLINLIIVKCLHVWGIVQFNKLGYYKFGYLY